MNPLDIAAIGAGAFASRRHPPELQRDPRVRSVAACRTDPDLPPMGMRVRLKAGHDVSGFPRATGSSRAFPTPAGATTS